MRTLDAIAEASTAAVDRFDADALLGLADELSAFDTDAARAIEHNNRGLAAAIRGASAEAIEHFQQALSIRIAQNDTEQIGSLLTNIGMTYAGRSDYAEALEYFHRARALHEQHDRPRDLGATITNIGLVHYDVGDYIQAVSHLTDALDIFTSIDNQQLMALVYHNLGRIHVKLDDHEEAERLFRTASEIHQREGDHFGVATVCGHLGSVHARRGEIDEAIVQYERSIDGYLKVNDHMRADHARMDLATVLLSHDRVDEADALSGSVDPAKHDDGLLYMAAHTYQGLRALHRDDAHSARVEFEAALRLATDKGVRHDMIYLHEQLRDVAEQLSDLPLYVHHNAEWERLSSEVQSRTTTMEVAAALKERDIRKEQEARERERDVLYSALPAFIADRVVKGEDVRGDVFHDATVLFVDIASFTEHATTLTPHQITSILDEVYHHFDLICRACEITKIKTIGDSYMAAAFVSNGTDDHENSTQARCARATLQMVHSRFVWPDGRPIVFRAGIHSGSIVAGIVGTTHIQFDVWGEAVAIASRMESTGEPGRVQVSSQFATALGNGESGMGNASEARVIPSTSEEPHSPFPITYSLRERGAIEVKGKGPMTTYWLEEA